MNDHSDGVCVLAKNKFNLVDMISGSADGEIILFKIVLIDDVILALVFSVVASNQSWHASEQIHSRAVKWNW